MVMKKKISSSASRDKICKFCNKGFSNDNTLSAHMCVKKRRYADQNAPGSLLGFRIFQMFHELTSNSKDPKSVIDFINSKFYLGFVKFARYVISINPFAADDFIRYVIMNGIGLSDWPKDSTYQDFLVQYIKKEPPERAVERTIAELSLWAEENGKTIQDFFNEVSTIEAVFLIKTGRISPWVIYLSTNGDGLLNRMSTEQISMVSGIIDPNKWNLIMHNKIDDSKFIKQVLQDSGI